jgi:hypothetical protein
VAAVLELLVEPPHGPAAAAAPPPEPGVVEHPQVYEQAPFNDEQDHDPQFGQYLRARIRLSTESGAGAETYVDWAEAQDIVPQLAASEGTRAHSRPTRRVDVKIRPLICQHVTRQLS